jgi:hypothetical protein
LSIFLKSVKKTQILLKTFTNIGALQEHNCAGFFTISLSVPLRMRNVPDESRRANRKTHLCPQNFLFSEYLAFNLGKYGTTGQLTEGNIIRRMRIAYWMTKATDTHSEYVISVTYSQKNCYANAPRC